MMKNTARQIREIYGNIDIYLFDQLMKGTYADCNTILDAGCGSGRNLEFFLRQGCDVYGIDKSAEAINAVQQLASNFCSEPLHEHFMVADVESLPFANESFDLVISSAVLHFANNLKHFEAMVHSMWRVLNSGGFLFVRLASDIGIESGIKSLGDGRYVLPDETERFLVSEEMLLELTNNLGGALYEPIKTTNVQGLRCMTTWCIQKLNS
ncbi:class I SAM-dependent methyltransferase [Pedobacter aquatilis]|uniref:class I SAM-dependent methyltransferase n=1 Tax=Pedobacter aquatilis TaxID=351343 RepID=UPI0025B53D1F|nr:class I SAM-dependent methyltransferase [Pedobacter aquatilis]MDN3588822.1 class I SAM-dependent methyltransferase [Pedobacter aquatilis]